MDLKDIRELLPEYVTYKKKYATRTANVQERLADEVPDLLRKIEILEAVVQDLRAMQTSALQMAKEAIDHDGQNTIQKIRLIGGKIELQKELTLEKKKQKELEERLKEQEELIQKISDQIERYDDPKSAMAAREAVNFIRRILLDYNNETK